jgi:hypothetical protein
MSLSRRWTIPLVVVGLIALVFYTWLFHQVFTSRVPGANDFLPRWAGARMYLTRGWDPYGEQTSHWIQTAVWGHPAGQDEDPSLFAYPFYVIFLLVPYALLPTYAWAQAAWQVTLLGVVLATTFLLLRYHRWWPGPLLLGTIVLWAVFFYPAARAVILGQLALPVFLLTVVALWLVYRTDPPDPTRDVWAGVLLALTTIKPQMQFLIIPLVLLWALRERRWHLPIAFGAALAVLFALSFILLPTWLVGWLEQLMKYPGYSPPSVLYILTREIIPLGAAAGIVERVLDAGLAIYLLYEWWRVLWRREDARLDWVIGLTLVITHLIAPRTATTHFVVFLFPLFALFRDVMRRRSWGVWAMLALMLFLLVALWWLFLATVDEYVEANLMHVPFPFLMLLIVLLIRPRAESGAVTGAAS